MTSCWSTLLRRTGKVRQRWPRQPLCPSSPEGAGPAEPRRCSAPLPCPLLSSSPERVRTAVLVLLGHRRECRRGGQVTCIQSQTLRFPTPSERVLWWCRVVRTPGSSRGKFQVQSPAPGRCSTDGTLSGDMFNDSAKITLMCRWLLTLFPIFCPLCYSRPLDWVSFIPPLGASWGKGPVRNIQSSSSVTCTGRGSPLSAQRHPFTS